MKSIVQQVQDELAGVPEPLQREVLDFARFVRERAERAAREQADLLAAAESAWGPDWSNADEDDAWAML